MNNKIMDITSIEERKKQKKEWNKNNVDKCREYRKKYRTNNVEKVLEGKKKYYQDNKEKIAEYNKKYRLDNKISCSCGGKYIKCNKSNHERTKKHQKFIKNQNSLN